MTITNISKEHTFPRGKRKGQTKPFVVKPREKDGKFCVKKPDEKSNRDEAYRKLNTLDEVATYTQKGWRVRMWCAEIEEWNTLKSEGLKYA